jgi:hypothetical protein
MKAVKFESTVLEGHKGPGFEVPFDPAEKWGIAPAKVGTARNGHRVRLKVNGEQLEAVVVPRMRRFFAMTEAPSTLAAGERVSVSIEPLVDEVSAHFAGRDPVVRRIYDRLLAAAKKFGPVNEESKKTSIHLATEHSAFAGIATRKDSLILTLKSDRDYKNERVIKHEQASANRWHLEVRLTQPADVDNELKAWLRSAYALSS